MKMMRLLVLPMMAAIPWLSSFDARGADVSVGVEVSSVNDFYEPLSSQGYWVEVGPYGRCWHPYYVESTWRPYCEGTWVWTDDGWYWQSDESWGWACYHYGRWWNDPYYGWVWVPDTVWGPSWVCFREGGGYCGWAPLPPGWHGGVVISADIVPAGWFIFVGEHHFGEHHRVHDVIVNNTTIINRTTIINKTRTTTVNHQVIADGPRVQDIQRVSHERIRTSTVQELRQHERVPPSLLRKTTQPPAKQRENERQIERPPTVTPERERPRNNPPEVIRGTPNAPPPASPPPEKQERPQPPPEHKEHIERQPSGPPAGERAAPPPQQRPAPPPQEERREKGPPPQGDEGEGHGQGRDGEPGGRGR